MGRTLPTLTQRLINEGIVAEDSEAILRTGFWMFILALVAGFAGECMGWW